MLCKLPALNGSPTLYRFNYSRVSVSSSFLLPPAFCCSGVYCVPHARCPLTPSTRGHMLAFWHPTACCTPFFTRKPACKRLRKKPIEAQL